MTAGQRLGSVIRIIFKPLEWLMLGLIRLYQVAISPLLGPKCRFYPSCSKYGYEAISTHGPFKGLVLTVYRVGRCHPWQRGGIDPVPTKGSWQPEVNLDGSPRSSTSASKPTPPSSASTDSLEYRA